jgi:phosphoribosylanthranilate isomerase
MDRMFVKICGITNLEDALAAVAAGADMLGFNFYRSSSRYIEPRAAREIIDEFGWTNLLTVGVFVNEKTPELLEQVADEAGVCALQLHGDESPDYCRALKRQHVIKVLRVTRDFVPERALDYKVESIMLDAFDKDLRGGTGQTIDWSIARRTRELVPKLFLAGGLAPENVAAAIAAVEPYAVDVCSAVETAPGKKDAQRMREFVRAAKAHRT